MDALQERIDKVISQYYRDETTKDEWEELAQGVITLGEQDTDERDLKEWEVVRTNDLEGKSDTHSTRSEDTPSHQQPLIKIDNVEQDEHARKHWLTCVWVRTCAAHKQQRTAYRKGSQGIILETPLNDATNNEHPKHWLLHF